MQNIVNIKLWLVDLLHGSINQCDKNIIRQTIFAGYGTRDA